MTLNEGRCAEAAFTKPNRISVLRDLMLMISGNKGSKVKFNQRKESRIKNGDRNYGKINKIMEYEISQNRYAYIQ